MFSKIRIKVREPDCIRLVQITDTHIFNSTEDDFDGVDTSASLSSVIEHIKQQKEQPDMVIVTGDLVHDPVPAAYHKLWRQLSDLDSPTFCLPGNHDDPVLMHNLLNREKVHTNKLVEAAEWVIVLLDTYLESSHSGSLKCEELTFLQQSLEQVRDKFVLVCLHHPPVSIGSAWMDAMTLENPEDLFEVLDKYESVRAIIWGHIHQLFMRKRHDVIMYGSPSTCVQFKPGSDEYVRDDLGPAYSILQLHRDGRVEIETQRL